MNTGETCFENMNKTEVTQEGVQCRAFILSDMNRESFI